MDIFYFFKEATLEWNGKTFDKGLLEEVLLEKVSQTAVEVTIPKLKTAGNLNNIVLFYLKVMDRTQHLQFHSFHRKTLEPNM